MTDDNGKIPEIGSSNIDRGEVNLGKSATKKKNTPIILGIMGLGIIIIIFSFMKIFSLTSSKETVEEPSSLIGDTVLTDYSQNDDANTMTLANQMKVIKAEEDERRRIAEQNRLKEEERLRKLNEKTNPASTSNNLTPANIASSPQNNANGEPVITPYDRKRQGDVLLGFATSSNNSNNGETGGNAADASLGQGQQMRSNNLNDDLMGTIYPDGHAYVRNNLDYLLIHGTTISCVLKTKIVTAYKGLTICQIPKDVYSANGKILLIERGSSVFGEQKIAITQGKARVFVNWTDIETPNGVSVRIDSLGTDTLGASGQEAWIDNHFKERFGSAILLSFLDAVFQYAENSANDNNSSSNGFTFNNSSNSPSDMASKALENSINIPPTGYVNQGALLNILVARDIDMRNIYTTKYRER